MNSRLPSTAWVWLALALLGIGGAFAHEGPEHEIEELTERIDNSGETADLLLERAIEYAVLGKNPEAMRDLERALHLDPASLHAHRELGRLQFHAGRTNEAIATVTRALRLPIEDPIDRGGLLILRAEILRARNRLRPALDDCHAALRLHPGNPEWYLLRSDLQRRLKQHRQRLAGLAEGIAQTSAGILVIEQVEALLEDGQYRMALKQIEPELESSRIRCRWLVRRGRALPGLGQKPAGEEDLRTALAQIDTILDPARPDATLLLDQATAHALLGDRDAARRVLDLARDKGGDPAITERIRTLTAKP